MVSGALGERQCIAAADCEITAAVWQVKPFAGQARRDNVELACRQVDPRHVGDAMVGISHKDTAAVGGPARVFEAAIELRQHPNIGSIAVHYRQTGVFIAAMRIDMTDEGDLAAVGRHLCVAVWLAWSGKFRECAIGESDAVDAGMKGLARP